MERQPIVTPSGEAIFPQPPVYNELALRQYNLERALAAERARKRRRKERVDIQETARHSRAGLLASLAMGEWAIGRAIRFERNPKVRRERRNMLLGRWRQFSGDLLLMAYVRRGALI